MLDEIITKMKDFRPWNLLWMSVLSTEIMTAIIVSLMSLLFHGKVVRDYVITGGVAALLASFVIAFLLIRLIDSIRKTEKKAEAEKDRIATYLNIAEFIFVVIGIDQKVVFINKKGAEILGYEEREVTGRSWFDNFIPGRQREEVKTVFNKMIGGKAGSVEYYENFVLTREGQERMIAWHNVVLADERGTVTGTLSSGEDITEHEKWQDSLQEQKKFTENMLEHSAVATYVINPEHKIVLWNKACEELTGVSASEVIGTDNHWKPFYDGKRQTLADVIVDGNFEDLAGLYGSHTPSVLIERGLQTEGWYKNLNGRDRYIIFDAAPIYDSRGTLTAVIETLQDLTSQKRMEEELAKSEGQLRAIIDTEPECVKLFATDGTILEMNAAGLAMVEADSPEQIVGKSMMPCILPDYRAAVEEHSKGVFQGAPGSIEFEIIGLKGTRRWLDSRVAPLRNPQGEIYALLGVSRDITERKKAEEKLKLLKKSIDIASDAAFWIDPEGKFVYVNDSACKSLGYDHDELMNMSLFDINPLSNPADWGGLWRQIREQKKMQIESIHRRKDGKEFPVEIVSTYVKFGDQEYLCGFARDITERKKSEKVIQRNYDTHTAINWVLNISLKDIPLESVLKQTLDLLLSIPWLSQASRGSIFLVEDDPDSLVMKAQRGLSDGVLQNCGTVPFGACLCGRAAARREVQFTDSVDEHHEFRYDGMAPHSHYCVPIMRAKTVLGVINLYLNAGHQRDDKEIEFLNAIASALAGIIQRKRTEEERERLIGDLRTVLDAITRSYKE